MKIAKIGAAFLVAFVALPSAQGENLRALKPKCNITGNENRLLICMKVDGKVILDACKEKEDGNVVTQVYSETVTDVAAATTVATTLTNLGTAMDTAGTIFALADNLAAFSGVLAGASGIMKIASSLMGVKSGTDLLIESKFRETNEKIDDLKSYVKQIRLDQITGDLKEELDKYKKRLDDLSTDYERHVNFPNYPNSRQAFRKQCNVVSSSPEDIFIGLYQHACGDNDSRDCREGLGTAMGGTDVSNNVGVCPQFGTAKSAYLLDYIKQASNGDSDKFKAYATKLIHYMALAQFFHAVCLPDRLEGGGGEVCPTDANREPHEATSKKMFLAVKEVAKNIKAAASCMCSCKGVRVSKVKFDDDDSDVRGFDFKLGGVSVVKNSWYIPGEYWTTFPKNDYQLFDMSLEQSVHVNFIEADTWSKDDQYKMTIKANTIGNLLIAGESKNTNKGFVATDQTGDKVSFNAEFKSFCDIAPAHCSCSGGKNPELCVKEDTTAGKDVDLYGRCTHSNQCKVGYCDFSQYYLQIDCNHRSHDHLDTKGTITATYYFDADRTKIMGTKSVTKPGCGSTSDATDWRTGSDYGGWCVLTTSVPKWVKLETNTGDAFGIDEMWLYKENKKISYNRKHRHWGRENGGFYCLSTDRDDYSKGKCSKAMCFNVDTGVVYRCG